MRVLLLGALALGGGATAPARQAVRRPARDGGRTIAPGPLLVAARKVEDPTEGGWAAAGGLAALAVASEVVQYANTALLVLLLRRLTHTASMADLAEVVIAWFRALGWVAYPVYIAMLCSMQVLPLFSALIFIVLSGAVFGAAKGTAVVSFSLTAAAVTCCGIGRLVAKRIGYDLSKISPPAAAIDKAMSEQQPGTSLLLVLLIRLSPVVPFTFSNYLFGLTSVSLPTLGLATLLGTLPSQAAYVTAGALGQQALSGQLSVPPAVLIAGSLATVGAVVVGGKVAQKTLARMEFDSNGTKPKRRQLA